MEFGTVSGRSTLGALRTIMKAEGVAGLFGGLGPTVLSNAPFAGLYYMFYTRLQARHGLVLGGWKIEGGSSALLGAGVWTPP